ncbi:MAG: HAD-IA family hydrolase [Hylemonella sp.]|nr:HAD-IA family hydrolase [Hylemonella sp.]
MLSTDKIRAISLDLDDTLWPIKPIMVNAERVLRSWFREYAPMTAVLCEQPGIQAKVRADVVARFPDQLHDLGLLRRESIRVLLSQAGDDPTLAESAFEIFHAQRQRVEFFADALPALERLSQRWPLVAVSNGTADLVQTGLSRYFQAGVSAQSFGVAKPDPRIFEEAARLAGVDTAQVLHVGDDAELDGKGALASGMQVAWINRFNHSWTHAAKPHMEVSELLALCDALDV